MASIHDVLTRSEETKLGGRSFRVFLGETPIRHKGRVLYAQAFFDEEDGKRPAQILAGEKPNSDGRTYIPYEEVEFITVEHAQLLDENKELGVEI